MPHRPTLAAVFVLVLASALAACASLEGEVEVNVQRTTLTPTPSPTPTLTPTATPSPTPTAAPPPAASALPPLTLPADESPHSYAVEWWYFNAHFASEDGARYTLHDTVFKVELFEQQAYVRQIGLVDAAAGYVSGELSGFAEVVSAPGDFEVAIDGALMSGAGGETYRLRADVDGYAYDLTLRATTEPLLHRGAGLVDFREAGITYYYTRPRLAISGTLTPPGGAPASVTGLAWLDKQWGNFQPIAVEWDWASLQLDDGTDLMVSSLYELGGPLIDRYATLRRPGEPARTLMQDEIAFTPEEAEWTSPETGTAYRTAWRVKAPSEDISLTLRPLAEDSEFIGDALPIAYWDSGVDALDDAGNVVGQGFVELNWAMGSAR